MKLETDPLKVLRSKRKEKVNSNFAVLYTQDSHRHAAHARKREIAKTVLKGIHVIPKSFEEEARMRGMSTTDFAEMVISKDSELDKLELQRQKVLARIDSATTLDELNSVGDIDA